MCSFPWIISNLRMKGKPLVDCLEYTVVEHQGFKIGLFGIAEYEWVETLAQFEVSELEFEDPFDSCDRVTAILSMISITSQGMSSSVISSSGLLI